MRSFFPLGCEHRTLYEIASISPLCILILKGQLHREGLSGRFFPFVIGGVWTCRLFAVVSLGTEVIGSDYRKLFPQNYLLVNIPLMHHEYSWCDHCDWEYSVVFNHVYSCLITGSHAA